MSGTRLRKQIGLEESIPIPLERSTKSFPVAFLSSFDPWSTLPINRAQLWPLTWPLSPVCCRLTFPSGQQREEITSDIASARCPKPFPHIAAAFQTEQTAPSGPHWILLRFSKCSTEACFMSVQKTMQRYNVIFRNKMCKHFQMCSSKCIVPRDWRSFA